MISEQTGIQSQKEKIQQEEDKKLRSADFLRMEKFYFQWRQRRQMIRKKAILLYGTRDVHRIREPQIYEMKLYMSKIIKLKWKLQMYEVKKKDKQKMVGIDRKVNEDKVVMEKRKEELNLYDIHQSIDVNILTL